MMKTISIRLEDHDYSLLNDILKSMGQTKQTFYETYTKTVLRLRKIPFIIEADEDPFYSEENMAELKRRIADMNAGRNISEHELVEVDG